MPMQEDCERDALKEEIALAIEAEIASIRASNINLRQLSIELATARVYLKHSEETIGEYETLLEKMQGALRIAINHSKERRSIDEAQQAKFDLAIQDAFNAGQKVIKQQASKRAKAAANALHDQPGSSREKQAAIRAIWATGKYKSRDLCAEQECAALDMAVGTARRALRGTPDPT